jgi:tetratricopeptide (TPR) repeat protein
MKARRLTLIIVAILVGLAWNLAGWRFTFGLVGALKNHVSAQFPGGSLATNSRIIFPQATVNGRPAKLMLDTGASSAVFTDAGATRLGVKIALPAGISPIKLTDNTGFALSEPVRVTVSAETFTAPVLVLPYNLADVDGSIGWPEVRDNLLVFDPTTRAVHSVEKLPPETSGSGWLKLKIPPSNVLVLETVSPNGHAADIAVDTGADYGVALAPAQWKEWRAAHPNATINTESGFMPGAGGWKVEESFADNLKLGALTLTAVSVRQANQAELATTGDYIGSLGLEALARMDLVVDGKNGVAYLRPRSVSANPSAQNQDWTVTGPISLKSDALLVIAGNAKSAQGDYAGALADINQALVINPNNVGALSYRGASKNNNRDFAGAIADYTRALELDPKNAEVYADRGNAKRNQGDHDGALADFNQALELEPKNTTALLARANLQMQKDPKSSITDFDEYLKINSKDAVAYAHRAGAKYNEGDYAGAVADYSHALDMDPKNATTWLWRGYSNARLGDTPSAIADFTQTLALDPKNSRAYANRGYAREVQGRFDDALADYDQAIELKPDDSDYPPLCRQLLLQRLNRPDGGFSATVAAWKDGWTKTIGQFVAGSLSEADFLAVASQGEEKVVPGHQCEAFYYAGVMHLLQGDQPGARDFFNQAIATGQKEHYEYQLARAELVRLEAPAAK